MIKFKQIIQDINEVSVEGFMSKIASCNTTDGLKELDKYYKKRSKEVELKDSDDISIRDALEGRKAELETEDEEVEEEF